MTASRAASAIVCTIDELKAESATLGRLEALASAVRRSGEDRK